MINVFIAAAAIVLCFPLGVLLALGRRSKLPLLKAMCTAYIEVFRGSPLFVLLLLANNALEFFVPSSMAPGVVVRAIVVFTLFTAAYLAEIVRGGLQSVPPGQEEAAKALGLVADSDDVPDRAAAGAAQRDPRADRPVHQPVQGRLAGRRGDGRVRPARRRARRSPSSRTSPASGSMSRRSRSSRCCSGSVRTPCRARASGSRGSWGSAPDELRRHRRSRATTRSTPTPRRSRAPAR